MSRKRTAWEQDFERRIEAFEKEAAAGTGVTISIKIRITSGCFHREHSPHAYSIIDEALRQTPEGVRFEEHETGPEVLVWLAAGAAALSFTKSVIDLVTAIIKARAEGIKKGDRPSDAIELIVRVNDKDGVTEERLLRFRSHDPVRRAEISKALHDGAAKLLGSADHDKSSGPDAAGTGARKPKQVSIPLRKTSAKRGRKK